jgi:hypothetical protein
MEIRVKSVKVQIKIDFDAEIAAYVEYNLKLIIDAKLKIDADAHFEIEKYRSKISVTI